MGSQSDWQTMRKASDILEELLIPHETKIVSRFWMIGILLAILTLTTLKLR